MEVYNSEKVIKVEVFDFESSRWYSYTEKDTKIFGIVVSKKGVYTTVFNQWSSYEAPENHIIKNNDVFKKPRVKIYYQNDHIKTYFFDTYEKAVDFYDEVTAEPKFIRY